MKGVAYKSGKGQFQIQLEEPSTSDKIIAALEKVILIGSVATGIWTGVRFLSQKSARVNNLLDSALTSVQKISPAIDKATSAIESAQDGIMSARETLTKENLEQMLSNAFGKAVRDGLKQRAKDMGGAAYEKSKQFAKE